MYPSGSWQLRLDNDSTCRLVHDESGVSISHMAPLVRTDDRTFSGWTLVQTENTLVATEPSGLRMTITLAGGPGSAWVALEAALENGTGRDLSLEEAGPVSGARAAAPRPLDRALVNGRDMCGYSALHAGDGDRHSSNVLGFSSACGSASLVLGALDLDRAFYWVRTTAADGVGENLSAVMDREGIVLKAGAALDLGTVIIGAGEGLSALMDSYARAVAGRLGYRDTPPPAGWCSWYYYYDTTTEEALWENARAIKASPYAGHMKVIQLDDGWNRDKADTERFWGDWFPGDFFPGGMKKLADDLKAEGFVPGLWLAPFSVDKTSRFAAEHPDLLIHGDTDPLDCWGSYGLDLSHPDAQSFVRETFTRVFNEWGFQYIKIDFLLHALGRGKRHDSTLTSAECYRIGLGIIREVAGDNFILCCGAPMGPSIGLCDGMRIGLDVSSRWNVPVNPEGWPKGNLNIIGPATHTAWRQWMHGRWWQNDPDCIVTRDYGSAAEKRVFEKAFPQFATEPPYGLSDEEARCWSQLVWFTGGMALVSENMAELEGPRFDLLQHSFPPNPDAPRYVDWYENPEVVILRTQGEPPAIGVFNLGDTPVSLEIPRERLGLGADWSYGERLNGEVLMGSGDTVVFPELPPHAGRVWLAK